MVGLGVVLGVCIVIYMLWVVYMFIFLVVLVIIGIYIWRRLLLGVGYNGEGGKYFILVLIIGLFFGCYDGVIGLGVGIFWVFMYVVVGGYFFFKVFGMVKICNVVINFVIIIMLVIYGYVWWYIVWLLVILNVFGGLIGV